jgi:hypothetical protein
MSTLTAPQPRVRDASAALSDAWRARHLGQYATSHDGETREIVSLHRPDGSTLVIDRLAGDLADARLVAQLAPEEPIENAQLICEMYLADPTRGHCRPLSEQDRNPARDVDSCTPNGGISWHRTALRDADGHIYRIRELASAGSLSELRWTRSRHPGQADPFEPVSLRDVVGGLEDYEPARTFTAEVLAVHGQRCEVSVCRLAGELERLARSPIVLNRGLREAVQRELAREELSMSEIAMRCGRVKRDRRGSCSGETSWLARRIGQLPEGGQDRPTPWVHSDTLALIVREGLAMSPNEVEL